MATPKPRILPWLKAALDQERFPGVAWLDSSRTRFRIPWKHGLRQDAQQEDFGIFLAWAEVSGAHTPGDKPDLPTCKRNFRAALNRKEGLRVAQDLSKDPQDPHKVYEFVTPGVGDSPGLDSNPDTQEVLESLNDMHLASYEYRGPPGLEATSDSTCPLLMMPLSDTHVSSANCEPSDNPIILPLLPEDAWDFQVTVFYRGRQVFEHTALCPWGLRLVGPDGGDPALEGVPFILPDPSESLVDQAVKNYVTRVLQSLGGGLLLWRDKQGLCARRLGHCHTYWALGEEHLPPTCKPEGEVPKEHGRCIFDLRHFVEGLIAFINGSQTSPHFTLWFCLGEFWPKDQPWTKKLVMVKVIPTCLQKLLELARQGGASSLNSVELQISGGQSLSLNSEQLVASLEDLLDAMEY